MTRQPPLDHLRDFYPDQDNLPALKQVAARYAVSVTDATLDIIASADDPVGRQYLPQVAELVTRPEEMLDPIGDQPHSPVPGIVHRYPDRVLLKPVHVCSVYCRFCFRREMVGPGSEALDPAELEAALDYIRNTPAVWEVILTGGDPFVLSPRRLGLIMEALNKIEHVKVIRFHTRVPVADPLRVTPELVAALQSEKAVYVVVHCNHANELSDKARAAVQLLVKAGIPLLSQSVLLRGVNDTVEALEKLFRSLVEIRIKPYYLHHPDMAPGTSHFRLPVSEGQSLAKSLLGKVSGLAQPRYVLDIPGGHGKAPLLEGYYEDGTVTDYKGRIHEYPDDN